MRNVFWIAFLLFAAASRQRLLAQAPIADALIPKLGTLPIELSEMAGRRLRLSDYDSGILCLRMAIALNAVIYGDAGAEYDPSIVVEPSKAALQHGRLQLLKMTTDRPLMDAFVRPSDEIWNWTMHKYSVRILGSEIEWDRSPPNGFAADHSPPEIGTPGRIRIINVVAVDDVTKAEAFERMWCLAVFELHNMGSTLQFHRLNEQVRKGEITLDAYVKSMFALEIKAAQQTRMWYVAKFLPHAKKYSVPTNPTNWYSWAYGSIDELFDRYTDKNSYPWEPYSRNYELAKARRVQIDR